MTLKNLESSARAIFNLFGNVIYVGDKEQRAQYGALRRTRYYF